MALLLTAAVALGFLLGQRSVTCSELETIIITDCPPPQLLCLPVLRGLDECVDAYLL